jgi:hypothetical protein
VEYPRCSEDSLYSVYNNNNNLQYVIYHNEYIFLTKKGSTKNMLLCCDSGGSLYVVVRSCLLYCLSFYIGVCPNAYIPGGSSLYNKRYIRWIYVRTCSLVTCQHFSVATPYYSFSARTQGRR